MFENRTHKEQIIIYAIIALIVTLGLSVWHFYSWSGVFSDPIVIVIMANIEFALIFYLLYLPVKVKRAREKEEKKKK